LKTETMCFRLYPIFVETVLPKKRSHFVFSLKAEFVGRVVKLRRIRLRLRVKSLFTIGAKHNSG
jgi:hypothetical protein